MTTPTGSSQFLSTSTTEMNSVSSYAPPASENPPGGGCSRTASVSQTGITSSLSGESASGATASSQGESNTVDYGTASTNTAGGPQAPSDYNTGNLPSTPTSSTSSGRPTPTNYNTGTTAPISPPSTASAPITNVGGNSESATSSNLNSATSPISPPVVSVCPGYDGSYFTAPAYGSGTYKVDCDSAYAGDEIVNPIRYGQPSYSPQQGDCMATCDSLPACVAINVRAEGCEYFSRVDDVLVDSPGTIALSRTTQANPSGYPGNTNAISAGTLPSSSQTPRSSTPTMPGSSFISLTYPSVGSMSASRTSTPLVVTVTVCKSQRARTTTVFTTNTVTTCAAEACPR